MSSPSRAGAVTIDGREPVCGAGVLTPALPGAWLRPAEVDHVGVLFAARPGVGGQGERAEGVGAVITGGHALKDGTALAELPRVRLVRPDTPERTRAPCSYR